MKRKKINVSTIFTFLLTNLFVCSCNKLDNIKSNTNNSQNDSSITDSSNNSSIIDSLDDVSSQTLSKPSYFYEKDKQIRIAAFIAPYPKSPIYNNPNLITEEQYQYLQDCCFNTVYGLNYDSISEEDILLSCKLASEHDINYYVCNKQNMKNINTFNKSYFDQLVSYKDVKGCKGVLFKDEPSKDEFKYIKDFKDEYEKALPNNDFYINLFPTYANETQLATSSYEDYIQSYIDIVKPSYVSFDFYPLCVSNNNNTISNDFLLNLDIISKKCKDANIDMMSYIAARYAGPNRRNYISKEELNWQIMTNLAYGSKGIQYFSYCTQLGISSLPAQGLIDKDGNRSEKYYYAKEVNNNLLKMDEAYHNFKWEKTIHLTGTTSTKINDAYTLIEDTLPQFEHLDFVSSTLDSLIGCFHSNVDNREAYLVTNFNEPTEEKIDEVTLTIKDTMHALVYENGKTSEIDIINSNIKLNINPGDGVFIIPYN